MSKIKPIETELSPVYETALETYENPAVLVDGKPKRWYRVRSTSGKAFPKHYKNSDDARSALEAYERDLTAKENELLAASQRKPKT